MDPKNVANAFNNFFITITEKLNNQQIEKADATSILKHSFPGNAPCLKIILITEGEIKKYSTFPETKTNHQVLMK